MSMKKDVINIYDIAEMAHVSIATVSRVVNGSDKVSEKTRKKVMAVIDEVGYTPNVFAQGLNHTPQVTRGVLKDECVMLLKDFFRELRKR